jgi:predicted lipoprotein with Yx(FWY)xxD motif
LVSALSHTSRTTRAGNGGKRAKSAPPPAIKVRRTRLGAVLTDARSRTLYLFNEDKHGRSTCHGACAMVWPPAPASGTPHAGHRVVARKLTTAKRGHSRGSSTTATRSPTDADKRPGDMEGDGLDT